MNINPGNVCTFSGVLNEDGTLKIYIAGEPEKGDIPPNILTDSEPELTPDQLERIGDMAIAYSRRPIRMTRDMTVYPSIAECLEYKKRLIKAEQEASNNASR